VCIFEKKHKAKQQQVMDPPSMIQAVTNITAIYYDPGKDSNKQTIDFTFKVPSPSSDDTFSVEIIQNGGQLTVMPKFRSGQNTENQSLKIVETFDPWMTHFTIIRSNPTSSVKSESIDIEIGYSRAEILTQVVGTDSPNQYTLVYNTIYYNEIDNLSIYCSDQLIHEARDLDVNSSSSSLNFDLPENFSFTEPVPLYLRAQVGDVYYQTRSVLILGRPVIKSFKGINNGFTIETSTHPSIQQEVHFNGKLLDIQKSSDSIFTMTDGELFPNGSPRNLIVHAYYTDSNGNQHHTTTDVTVTPAFEIINQHIIVTPGNKSCSITYKDDFLSDQYMLRQFKLYVGNDIDPVITFDTSQTAEEINMNSNTLQNGTMYRFVVELTSGTQTQISLPIYFIPNDGTSSKLIVNNFDIAVDRETQKMNVRLNVTPPNIPLVLTNGSGPSLDYKLNIRSPNSNSQPFSRELNRLSNGDASNESFQYYCPLDTNMLGDHVFFSVSINGIDITPSSSFEWIDAPTITSVQLDQQNPNTNQDKINVVVNCESGMDGMEYTLRVLKYGASRPVRTLTNIQASELSAIPIKYLDMNSFYQFDLQATNITSQVKSQWSNKVTISNIPSRPIKSLTVVPLKSTAVVVQQQQQSPTLQVNTDKIMQMKYMSLYSNINNITGVGTGSTNNVAIYFDPTANVYPFGTKLYVMAYTTSISNMADVIFSEPLIITNSNSTGPTSINISNLKENTVYKFQLIAVNGNGSSEPSDVVTFANYNIGYITGEGEAPSSPKIANTLVAGIDYLSFSFDSPSTSGKDASGATSSIESYTTNVLLVSETSETLVFTTTVSIDDDGDMSMFVDNLQSDTTYKVQVSATNTAGFRGEYTTQTIKTAKNPLTTTPPITPDPPITDDGGIAGNNVSSWVPWICLVGVVLLGLVLYFTDIHGNDGGYDDDDDDDKYMKLKRSQSKKSKRVKKGKRSTASQEKTTPTPTLTYVKGAN